jgi:serine/threonine protein kinase
VTAERWEKLQDLFHLAEDAGAAEREQLLARHCDDPDLCERVLAMLKASEKIEAPIAPAARPPKPEQIGPYSLVRCIGSGGMGTVYLVERDVAGLRQRAALKVLAPHAAGPSFVDRFHREQHILASLEHPNITRMLDAGLSSSGQPYLVMEFVEGKQLDAYCDEHRLSIEQRLRLFVNVCAAVDYAHRNLIVHLDLKPSNILITSSGTPKLLDFGTSKLLSSDGRFTSTYSATPSYASPEHLRNEAVTTACDIYSLGVILYELLTGRRPTGVASIATIIERALEDRQPPRLEENITLEAAKLRGLALAGLRASLAGDLSTIVEKALANHPQARYSSVTALTADIDRYLNHQPILARPQTTLYWLGKFVRRHRRGTIAGALLTLSLIVAIAYAFIAQRRATQEADRAARTQTFMNQLFRLANSNYAGKQVNSLNDFLALGLKMAPVLAPDKRQLAEIEASLAVSTHDSGNLAASIPAFERALSDARAAHDSNTEVESMAYLTGLYFDNGDPGRARSLGKEAVAKSGNSSVSPRARAEALLQLGYIQLLANQSDAGALHMLEQAAAIARSTPLSDFDRADITGNLAWAYSATSALNEKDRNAATERTARESLAVYKSLPINVCQVALPAIALARSYRVQHRMNDAEQILRDAYQHVSVCLGAGYDLSLAVLGNWGSSLVWTGHADQAVPKLEEGLAVARKTYAGRNAAYLMDILGPLSLAYEATGQPKKAEASAREMLQLAGADPNRSETAEARRTLGLALAAEHRYTEALPLLEAAYNSYSKHAPNSLFMPKLKEGLAQTRAALAQAPSQQVK